MNPIYNTGIFLYRTGVKAVAGRNPKAAKMIAGQKRSFDTLRNGMQPGRRYIWIHAASLGEFEQGRPLIEKIRRERPELGIVLSFFSPSGYEVRKNYKGADIVCYLPFDTPENARKWVDMLNPVAAIFVKYEFWGNYLEQLKSHDIPTYLISAIFRDSQSFFKWWGGTFRHMLKCYKRIFVQDKDSERRLASIGVTNVDVAGDTRFDRVTDIMHSTHEIIGLYRFAHDRKKIIFGSSWEADEAYYLPWLKSNPDVAAVIAPHEFDKARLEHLRDSLTSESDDTLLLSEYTAIAGKGDSEAALAKVHYIIVDSFGQLSSIYRYGDIAYIGGGFGHGIHNINEAAVYGMPVVFGPKHAKFKEASDLIGCGGGFEVNSPESVSRILSALVSDSALLNKAGKAAGDYIASSIGATDRIFPKLDLR